MRVPYLDMAILNRFSVVVVVVVTLFSELFRMCFHTEKFRRRSCVVFYFVSTSARLLIANSLFCSFPIKAIITIFKDYNYNNYS